MQLPSLIEIPNGDKVVGLTLQTRLVFPFWQHLLAPSSIATLCWLFLCCVSACFLCRLAASSWP